MTQRSALPSWIALERHFSDLSDTRISQLFEDDPHRFEDFSIQHDGLLLDFSKNLITHDTLSRLLDLAGVCDLKNWRAQMFAGGHINTTEDRAVLHTALRAPQDEAIEVDGINIIPAIHETLDRMEKFSDDLRQNLRFKNIVNIGIGGSDLGMSMACQALKPYAHEDINVYFVSNVDSTHLSDVLCEIDPSDTLFIVASKTFSTQETMTNAHSARSWLLEELDEDQIAEHFVAVTGREDRALEFGVTQDNIFPIWDWVGGRYSLWSAVGLSLCISVGFKNFRSFLDGAACMDKHFQTAPLHSNMPVMLGLIGIWNRNFCGFDALSLVPYDQSLALFPSYMQQVDMESNGKSVTRDGEYADYNTGPVIFGCTGTNAQHAYFQLLHQGTQIIPCDFIAFANTHNPLGDHHRKLLANMIAQGKALLDGCDHDDPHKAFEGNRPSNTILAEELNPYTLGMLLALYEHKIFVQGVIWNINSFDQCGVELGKQLAKSIMGEESSVAMGTDSSTTGLLSFLKQNKFS